MADMGTLVRGDDGEWHKMNMTALRGIPGMRYIAEQIMDKLDKSE